MAKFQNSIKTTLATLSLAILAWMAPTSLAATDVEWPQIRLDQNGNAVAIWDTVDDNNMRSIVSASQPSGGSWTTQTTISNINLDSFYPSISMNSLGDCVAAWAIIDPVWGTTAMTVALYDHTTGTWSSPTVLSNSGELIDLNYDCRIDPNGNAAVIWKSLNLNTNVNTIFTSSATIGGTWSTETAISQ